MATPAKDNSRFPSSESSDQQAQFDFGDGPTVSMSELEQEDARFRMERARAAIENAGFQTYEMREPCSNCGCPLGVLRVRKKQNTVSCIVCQRHCYNAPKTETGELVRSVQTLRQSIKPSQQARILDRDQGRCILCGTRDGLVLGHLLSVADGFALGALESELYDDANLAAMCEGCNAGLGRHSISPRTYRVILFRLVQAEIRRVGPKK
jgi:5-methylcytosine-specific restriction endonuclease McrA